MGMISENLVKMNSLPPQKYYTFNAYEAEVRAVDDATMRAGRLLEYLRARATCPGEEPSE